jgi:CBS domain-containing protein
MLVREVMTPRPLTVHPGTETKTALRLLDQHAVTSLPVVDGDRRIVGVVSEADLVREALPPDPRAHMIPAAEEPRPPRPHTVGEVMNRHPVSVHGDADLSDAVELMTSTAVKSLPVVDERRHVVGMVSRRDVVHLLARDDERIEREVDALYREFGVDWLVRVDDGTVTVEGPDDRSSRAVATSLAATVAGVTDVLIVPSTRSPGSQGDPSR